MEQKKILGVPHTEFGNTIKIAGVMLQGKGETHAVFFPEADEEMWPDNLTLNYPTHEEWKELIFQLDVVETEILDPNNKHQKVVVRKSQREIEKQSSWNVFRRDNYTCRYCGDNKTPLTVDHVVTWEMMGATVEDNLITACRKCNGKRGNMLFEDWLKSEYYRNILSGFKEHKEIAHNINVKAWEIAKAVPLRKIKRGR
jgi:5-methylcytosine-specific restriction endonuclease McrA